jgi:hypothetical protein
VSHTIKLRKRRALPNFADKFYIDQGIVVSVGGFHKPSLPKLAGICVKYKANVKSIRLSCIHSYYFSIGDKSVERQE